MLFARHMKAHNPLEASRLPELEFVLAVLGVWRALLVFVCFVMAKLIGIASGAVSSSAHVSPKAVESGI